MSWMHWQEFLCWFAWIAIDYRLELRVNDELAGIDRVLLCGVHIVGDVRGVLLIDSGVFHLRGSC